MKFNFKGIKNLETKDVCTAVAFIIYISAFLFILLFGMSIGNKVVARENADVEINRTLPDAQRDYKTEAVDSEKIYNGELMLVNGNYECEVDGADLVNIMENKLDVYKVTDYYAQINGKAMIALNSMLSDFYKTTGKADVFVTCGYRSKETQQEIYDNSVANNGQEYADSYVNKPGFSEHQTGYAFDLSLLTDDGIIEDFTGEGDYAWVEENCAKYGFILRYPIDKKSRTGIENEPWHFRYVGEVHAAYIMQNNLCLEEYIDTVHEHRVNNPLIIKDMDLNNYAVYFVPAGTNDKSDIPVPKDKQYEISGNNVDGFIVTYKL